MRKYFSFSLVISVALFFASCDSDGHYETTEDVVCFKHWTFSFGWLTDTLAEADPATFVSLKDWLGKDAQHAYYKDKIILGADPATLKAVKKPLCRDSRDYYFENVPMHVADMESFEVLDYEYSLWAKDSRYAYYDSTRVSVRCVKDFHVVDFCTATDNLDVYLFGQLLPGADPKTFEGTDGPYWRDKSHVWYLHTLMEDVDVASFKVDKEGNASDKYGRFYNDKRVGQEEDN